MKKTSSTGTKYLFGNIFFPRLLLFCQTRKEKVDLISRYWQIRKEEELVSLIKELYKKNWPRSWHLFCYKYNRFAEYLIPSIKLDPDFSFTILEKKKFLTRYLSISIPHFTVSRSFPEKYHDELLLFFSNLYNQPREGRFPHLVREVVLEYGSDVDNIWVGNFYPSYTREEFSRELFFNNDLLELSLQEVNNFYWIRCKGVDVGFFPKITSIVTPMAIILNPAKDKSVQVRIQNISNYIYLLSKVESVFDVEYEEDGRSVINIPTNRFKFSSLTLAKKRNSPSKFSEKVTRYQTWVARELDL